MIGIIVARAAKTLADEMEKTGLTPDNAAIRITHLLNEHKSLTDKLLSLAYTEEQLKRSINSLHSKEADLKKQTSSLQEKIMQYNSIIKNNEETYQLLLQNIENEEKRMTELAQEEIRLTTSIGLVEASLIKFKDELNKNRILAVLILLLAEPKSPIEPTLLFTTLIKLNRCLVEHFTANREVISNPQTFIMNVTKVMEAMGREYNIAKRKSL